MGFFYGGNIVGAVIGCVAAGFFLLRLYDVNVATYVAMGVNGLVAVLKIFLSLMTQHDLPKVEANSNVAALDARGVGHICIDRDLRHDGPWR